MSEFQPDAVFRVSPKVRFRRTFDEAVVIHQERAEALVLNDTGATFLELCDGKRSLQEIVSELLGTFDTDTTVLNSDIHVFTSMLLKEGIISRQNPSA